MFGSGRRRRTAGEWMRGLGLGFTNHVGSVGRVSVLRWCSWGVDRGLGTGSGRVG